MVRLRLFLRCLAFMKHLLLQRSCPLVAPLYFIFYFRVLHFSLHFWIRFSSYSWLAILIILAYMAMVIVILLNVLIAQLSYTYSEAKSNAKLQYAIDRIVIVTRIEYSRFERLVSVLKFAAKEYAP